LPNTGTKKWQCTITIEAVADNFSTGMTVLKKQLFFVS
jgi:hypothetical protein